ncbi:hypothetical protein [Rubinisphaera margarita]|uniref:hypothetical protein n=1 Tax=Rubinisphaera margarita TaxID=2909586 RepID=UPI001EE7AC0A|nr:hypothetical protein [Rubinisphaera margarita]MCG6157475.1 hypothetical protein [Rubinisphaera margarita]
MHAHPSDVLQIVKLCREIIQNGEHCGNVKQILVCVDLIPRSLNSSRAMPDLKDAISILTESELLDLFDTLDAELEMEKLNFSRVLVMACALACILEKRSDRDRHPFEYPPGRASEDPMVEHTLIMNNVDAWDETVVQRLGFDGLRSGDPFWIRAGVFVVGCWL